MADGGPSAPSIESVGSHSALSPFVVVDLCWGAHSAQLLSPLSLSNRVRVRRPLARWRSAAVRLRPSNPSTAIFKLLDICIGRLMQWFVKLGRAPRAALVVIVGDGMLLLLRVSRVAAVSDRVCRCVMYVKEEQRAPFQGCGSLISDLRARSRLGAGRGVAVLKS